MYGAFKLAINNLIYKVFNSNDVKRNSIVWWRHLPIDGKIWIKEFFFIFFGISWSEYVNTFGYRDAIEELYVIKKNMERIINNANRN